MMKKTALLIALMFAVSACTVTVHHSNGKVTRYNPVKDTLASVKASSERKKKLNQALLKSITDDKIFDAHYWIKEGANVNAYTNEHKNFPLQYVKSLNMAKLLVETGAKLNLRDNDGDNALDMAHLEGHPKVARYLEGKGLKGKNLNDLLFRTIEDKREHSTNQIKNLIQAGADVNGKNKDGYSPLEFALYQERPDRARILIENGAKLTTAKQKELAEEVLLQAALDKDTDVMRSLIAQGVNVNIKEKHHGQTLLHFAVYHIKNEELVKLLIENKADVNAKDNDDTTPLHYAKSVTIAKLLINNGADINVKDKSGYNPLDKAQNRGNSDVVTMLTELGLKHSDKFKQDKQKKQIEKKCSYKLVATESLLEPFLDEKYSNSDIWIFGKNKENKTIARINQEVAKPVGSITIPASCEYFTVSLRYIGESQNKEYMPNMVVSKKDKQRDVSRAAKRAGMRNDFVPMNNPDVIVASRQVRPGISGSIFLKIPVAKIKQGKYTLFNATQGSGVLTTKYNTIELIVK